MRLIDADALAKEWEGSYYEGTVKSLLDTAPTVTADPDTVSRQDVITLVENIENRRLMGEIDLTYAPMLKGVKALPPSPTPSGVT